MEGFNSFFLAVSVANSFLTSAFSTDLFLLRDFIKLSSLSSADSFASPLQTTEFFATLGEAGASDVVSVAGIEIKVEWDEEAAALGITSSDIGTVGFGRALNDGN